MKITTVGVDLAKNVFQVHGADIKGKTVLRKQLRRDQVTAFFANQIRGLLAEYGLVVPQGISHIRQRVPTLIEDATNELPGMFRALIDQLLDHLKRLESAHDF